MFINIPWKKFPILFKLIIGLGASLVLLLASIGYSYYVSNRLYESNALIERSDSLISQLNLLELKLAACESSVKAYAISDRATFLINYEKSRKDTRQYLQSLEKLTEGYPQQSEKFGYLRELYRGRFRLLEKAIAIKKREATDSEGLKKRQEQADSLQKEIQLTANDLKGLLKASLDQQKHESYALLSSNTIFNRIIIGLGCMIAAVLAVLVFKELRKRENRENKLRMMNNQKSQFFSIISHDLRGPTRNTNMLLEMMDDSRYASTPEESKVMAKMAMESAKQTQKLVEDLLTWSRLQMDQVEIAPSRFRPFEAADKVCQALQATALLKDITLENTVPFYLFMHADMNMIETVIRNLVSNAIKFTPTGGRVIVKAQRSREYVELIVEDSGVGMTQEVMGKIFSFHTKHATKGTAGEPGTGLGLVLCQEFVERNGGSISVESIVGQGSKFKIQLPAVELATNA